MLKLLEMHNIEKSFPGVYALKGVNFCINRGEVKALIGENGSGKSTLMKILSGAYTSDRGDILIDGKEMSINNPQDSKDAGIGIVYQELNLVDSLSIAENIFMGYQTMDNKYIVDWNSMFEKSRKILDDLDIKLDVHQRVSNLGIAQKQMVEIAKALSSDSRILIMDEPTAPLSSKEVNKLFEIISKLKEKGVAIIYITHRIEEVFKICDSVTIIRDGKNICDMKVKETNPDEIIKNMIGKSLLEQYPKRVKNIGEEIFKVENLDVNNKISNINFSVKAGEIFGITGLIGSGRTEIVRSIFGVDKKKYGNIYIDNKEIIIEKPIDAINAGIGFVTEDRKGEGLLLKSNVCHNATLASLKKYVNLISINKNNEEKEVDEYIQKLNIKVSSKKEIVNNLSGGNQQKIVLSKWLLNNPRVLILDEPTRGIDVGAKVEVYKAINELANAGIAIIVISSEFQEVIGICDRIMIMSNGKISNIIQNGSDVNRELLMQLSIRNVGEPTKEMRV